MNTPEHKKMIKTRIKNNDGFTYHYGKCKMNGKSERNKTKLNICKRADKKAVKRKELKFYLLDVLKENYETKK